MSEVELESGIQKIIVNPPFTIGDPEIDLRIQKIIVEGPSSIKVVKSGPAGPPGEDGEQGPPGEDGEQGPPGPNNLIIDPTEEGAAQQAADAGVTEYVWVDEGSDPPLLWLVQP